MSSTRRGLDRRTMLRVVGGVAAAGATGLLWRAHDQRLVGAGASVALEPWRTWRGDDDGALALVHAAVLAASPHNTQPWLFEVAPDRIDLFADETRNLGAIDPDRRELQIGLGCALENLALAAAPHGFRAEIRLGQRRSSVEPVASIALSAAPRSSSPLFDAIPRRHTDRGSFRNDSPPPASFLDEFERLTGDLPDARLVWWRSESDRSHFARETIAASSAIVADEEQAQASARWIRFDADEIERHRDGLGVDSLGLSPFVRTFLKLAPTPNRKRIDEGWLKATEEVHTATAPLFGAILVRDDRRLADRLQAGRLWQRLQLAATVEGIAGQPLSQLVERRDREVELGLSPRFGDALRTIVGAADWQAVLPFRLGRPVRAAQPSPRRAASDVLI